MADTVRLNSHTYGKLIMPGSDVRKAWPSSADVQRDLCVAFCLFCVVKAGFLVSVAQALKQVLVVLDNWGNGSSWESGWLACLC